MPALSKRDQRVSTALELFYQHGFNATGIDNIIAKAGVSKRTLGVDRTGWTRIYLSENTYQQRFEYFWKVSKNASTKIAPIGIGLNGELLAQTAYSVLQQSIEQDQGAFSLALAAS